MLVSEELKKVQTRNAEELIRHFRDAQREGNKYKLVKIFQPSIAGHSILYIVKSLAIRFRP